VSHAAMLYPSTDTRKARSPWSKFIVTNVFIRAVVMYRIVHTSPACQSSFVLYLPAVNVIYFIISSFIFGRRRFAVAGSWTWNSLPASLRDPKPSIDIFKRHLRTYFCAKY